MTHIVVDSILGTKLNDILQPVELCDSTGRVLGRFIPKLDPTRYGPLEPQVSEEELRRRSQSKEETKTTDEVIAHLEGLETSESIAAAKLVGRADVPLRLDEQGDIRVGDSRVLLDTIIGHFKDGMSPEAIVRGYDTIQPADVYETIAYYLRHKDDVEAYLLRRDKEAAALWQQIESSQPSKADLKAQIKERWSRRKADHASPAE